MSNLDHNKANLMQM